MNRDIYLQQVGLKALGFDPGALDGIPGKNTRAARAAWEDSLRLKDSGTGLQATRWNSAQITPSKQAEVAAVVNRILNNKVRYESVATYSGVPWYVIAGLHNMESSGSFNHHLHEGSPLTGRTKFEPKGRPTWGSPPFAWEDSAVDALKYDKMDKVNWESLEQSLQAIERYNGLGYQKYHPETPSPYLWAATSIEKPGKYVGDNEWSSTARSKQIGVAAILKELSNRGEISI